MTSCIEGGHSVTSVPKMYGAGRQPTIKIAVSYRKYKLTVGEWKEEIENNPLSASTWGHVFEDHPEFFRKNDEGLFSLMWRRALPQQLGLDMKDFRKDLSDATLDAKINRDWTDGVGAGVKGTPTIFVNGVLAGNVLSYDQLKGKLEAALK